MSAFAVSGLTGPIQLAYTEFTAPVTLTQSVEASADTIVTAGAVVVDGSTVIAIEFFSPSIQIGTGSNNSVNIWLFQDGSSIGKLIGLFGQTEDQFALARRFLTPAAGSRTYSIRGTRSGTNIDVRSGAGGAGNLVPGYIRVVTA